jgi:hypothetical protein
MATPCTAYTKRPSFAGEDSPADRWWKPFSREEEHKTATSSAALPSVVETRPPEMIKDGGTGPATLDAIPLLDITRDWADDMAWLEVAAVTGDEGLFIQAMKQIDWSKQSDTEWARAVHLALAAGARLAARQLAAAGTQRYPHHPELRKMSQVLAPPRVLNAHLPPEPSLKANIEWLQVHAAEYSGLWVAVRKGTLLAAAPTLRELNAQIKDRTGVLITKVV